MLGIGYLFIVVEKNGKRGFLTSKGELTRSFDHSLCFRIRPNSIEKAKDMCDKLNAQEGTNAEIYKAPAFGSDDNYCCYSPSLGIDYLEPLRKEAEEAQRSEDRMHAALKQAKTPITESQLRNIISEIIAEKLNEGKFGRMAAGALLGGAMALGSPSCSYIERNQPSQYNPQWEHEGPYSEQEKMEKTYNTHAERGDWGNVGQGEGFIYDHYTRCANSGGGWTIHVIFKDKSTGKFILPQHPEEYLYGRYVPNSNCFENENTTDHVNTNGLQRINGSENTTVFESAKHMKDEGYWKNNKKKNNMKQDKLTEALKKAIKESIQKVLKEGVIKSREFLDDKQQICYGEDAMSFFAANYFRNEFKRFPNIVQAKKCAEDMLAREKVRRASELKGLNV